jgi:hypothetical protein
MMVGWSSDVVVHMHNWLCHEPQLTFTNRN